MKLKSSSPVKTLYVAVVALTAGCTGYISDTGGPPPPPDTDAQQVPLSVDVVEGDGFCVDLASGEHLAAVSAEGHAWIVSEQNGQSSLRVLDALDAKNELEADLALTGIQRIQPWSQVDAAVTTADGLWRLEDLARVQLTPPAGFSGSASLCGDPGTNGSLLFGGKLFERRDDAQWWGWDTGASGSAAPSEILRQQGECLGPDDIEWMTSTDGTLWRLEPTSYYRPIKFQSLKAAAVTTGASGVMLAAIDGEDLWVGPGAWQRWTFEGGAPSHLTAAGGFFWMTSGSQLLRFDGETWTAVAPPESGSIEALFADEAGVWLARKGSACHVATGTLLRIDGIRPFSRSKELDHPFSLSSNDASATLSASVDGKELSLSVDPDTGLTTGSARLDQAGWHEIVARAGATERSVWLKRLPDQTRSWATDIEPIFQAHCADCHTTGADPGGPALTTYEAWTSRAKQIQERVIDAQNMPPAANRGPGWGNAQVEIIAQWLAGGMAP